MSVGLGEQNEDVSRQLFKSAEEPGVAGELLRRVETDAPELGVIRIQQPVESSGARADGTTRTPRASSARSGR